MYTFNRFTMVVLVLAGAVQISACDNQGSATDDQDTATNAEELASNSQDQVANGSSSDEHQTDRAGTAGAVAQLEATQGNSVSGTVSFTALERGVRVSADIRGLETGRHGFHVHARGDCSAPDASSAGGHFNPKDAEHGAPDGQTHHAGDLGNIEADDTGQVSLDREFSFLTLTGENGIVGKAVVVHAGADDLESQPAGDSGARVACGVISTDDQ